MRCFEAVARLGSVTQAAHELNVTHSAVSQQIKQLEDMMGVVFFTRESRGLRINEQGRLYALEIRSALRDIAEATRVARLRPQDDELVIAVLPSFGLQWLIPRLSEFQKHHPYRVRLQVGLEIQDLQHDMADLAIRMGNGDWPDLGREKLFDDTLLMVAAPHFRDGKLPATAQEIMMCPQIGSTESWSTWCRAAGIDETAQAARRVVVSANDSNLVIAAVKLGMGVALERYSLVCDALASGELVQVSPIIAPYHYAYWLAWPLRQPSTEKSRVFRTWIQEVVATHQSHAPSVTPGSI
jgi:LysR family glycine cleavage system transcriptional activator